MRFRMFVLLMLGFAHTHPAVAQFAPDTADQYGPAPATPLQWKWKRLPDNAYLHWVEKPGRPMILAVPAAPGTGGSGFSGHFARFLYDQGYALGVIEWRGDRARKQPPTVSAMQVGEQFAQLRAIGGRGAFDPNRVVLFGSGEGALLAALLSADRQRLAANGAAPPTVCGTLLLGPMNLDPARPDTYIARSLFARDTEAGSTLSPLARAASMQQTLVITDASDRQQQVRANPFILAVRGAGRTIEHETLPRFSSSDERTYLGLSGDRATPAVERFLARYCR
ncbi:MAG: hypothetical protein AVDCRST_MAG44-1562 [uncultured Sphingomonas sp.]|uniref:Serine aminopeptidase S33 domain-containing protein n=1 Tax=uncultured Sphingomonas sp. TaxID=158754 RepID=A0A6J4T5F1_9SPHN|nr:MAG: hypothetical protein AVDCRST_MAG44-1562 [uncultured Sphingomonas sp.]